MKNIEKSPKLIICDIDKCTGCRICEYTCAINNEKSINPRLSRIKVVRIEPIMNFAFSCRLCEDHPCIKTCPVDAIREDKKDGILKIDDDKCTGCGFCIEVCRYSVMTMHSTKKKARVCDFCREHDYKPKCVEFCPRDALEYKSLDDVSDKDFQKKLYRAFEEQEHPADTVMKRILNAEMKENENKTKQK